MRQVVLAFVLLAMVCGAWFWWCSDDVSVPHGPLPANARAEDAAAAQEKVAAPVIEPVAAPDRTPIAADAKWIEVRIVDAATKQPVPGADVRWIGDAASRNVTALSERERRPMIGNQHRVALRFGAETRSDDLGIARVTLDPHRATVFATAGTRYGTCFCSDQAPPGGYVLELREDQTLRVQVLDARGQPALYASVRIRFAPPGKPDMNRGWIHPEVTRSPDGIAEFAHVQGWLPAGPDPGPTAEFRAALDLPGVDDPGVVFDRAAPPAEPIVLRLPECGRVAMRLLHLGQPRTKDVGFTAYVGDDESRQRTPLRRIVPEEDGWARIPYVPVGVALRLTCRIGHARIERVVDIPPAPDLETRVEFSTAELLMVVGRMLDGDGKPLAGRDVKTEFQFGKVSGGVGGMGDLRGDADGRFLWFAGKAQERLPTHLASLSLVYTPREGQALRASVPPRDLVAGINDLGTVQLRCEPLVVAGRVQWDPPETKAQASVWVEALAGTDGPESERWQRVADVAITQRPDGAFEVRGNVRPLRHRLTVHSGGLPVDPVEFHLGAEDIVIRIVAGAELVANCLMPERLPRDALSAVLRPPGAHETERPVKGGSDRFVADASRPGKRPNELHWRALPAGTYALEVWSGLDRLLVIPDVVVPPPAGGDPRLVDIDLREKLRAVTVRATLVPPPERGGRTLVFVVPLGKAEEWEGVKVEGNVVVAAPMRAFELLAASSGYRPTRLSVGATQTEVVAALEAWPTVSLTIADAPALPEGLAWGVALMPDLPAQRTHYHVVNDSRGTIEDLGWPRPDVQPFVNGTATLPIGDGVFKIRPCLQRAGLLPRVLRNVTPAEVVGGRAVPPITIRLSADEVAAAITDLQKLRGGK